MSASNDKPVPGATATVLAPADAAPPGDDATPRAGTGVILNDPLTNSAANASQYAAISAAMGYGLDKLAEKYPTIERHFGLRFLEAAIGIGAQVPIMVVSHEAGHYREADADGANPTIAMTGFATAVTSWDTVPSSERTMVIEAAGVNQEQTNASAMFEKFAQNGGARYQEAMGYLLAQTNTALYALNSVRHSLQGNVASSDDIANYLSDLNAKGNALTKGQLAGITTAADLLSAPVWAALIGLVRFLVNGARDVAMPSFTVGNVTTTLPTFQTLLTTNGPVVGGEVMIDPHKKFQIEVSAYLRVDRQAAASVGVKLFDIPLGTDQVTLSPFVRGTYDERTGLGIAVGAELDAKVYKDVSLTASVEYSKNDLISEPEGTPEGVSGNVGIKNPFLGERLMSSEVTVKTVGEIGYYQGPNAIAGIKFRSAAKELGVTAWGMNVLEIDPGCSAYPEHDHAQDGQEEAYVVLRGSATLHADGKEWPLAVGNLVRVGPTIRRKFSPGPEGVTLLALGATPGKAYERRR